jgi:hypothetical protein
MLSRSSTNSDVDASTTVMKYTGYLVQEYVQEENKHSIHVHVVTTSPAIKQGLSLQPISWKSHDAHDARKL